jgi:hypothetical protein
MDSPDRAPKRSTHEQSKRDWRQMKYEKTISAKRIGADISQIPQADRGARFLTMTHHSERSGIWRDGLGMRTPQSTSPFISARKTPERLNVTTFFDGSVTGSPVCRFLPLRACSPFTKIFRIRLHAKHLSDLGNYHATIKTPCEGAVVRRLRRSAI